MATGGCGRFNQGGTPAMTITCRKCWADPGVACRRVLGGEVLADEPLNRPHKERYQDVIVPEPTVTPVMDQIRATFQRLRSDMHQLQAVAARAKGGG